MLANIKGLPPDDLGKSLMAALRSSSLESSANGFTFDFLSIGGQHVIIPHLPLYKKEREVRRLEVSSRVVDRPP
jgi:hypothetical protein